MAKIVSPIRARIEFVSRLQESSFQEGQYYRSVLFIDLSQPSGTEQSKIWKSLGEQECEGLTKGMLVELIPAGKTAKGEDKHNIMLVGAETPAPVSGSTPIPQETGWSPEQKRAIASKVQQHSDLLRYCLEVAQTKFDVVHRKITRAIQPVYTSAQNYSYTEKT